MWKKRERWIEKVGKNDKSVSEERDEKLDGKKEGIKRFK